jgi:hypothetical protein
MDKSSPGMPGSMRGDIKTPMSKGNMSDKGGASGKTFDYKGMPKADKSMGKDIYGPGTKGALKK